MNGFESKIFEMHNKPGGLCTAWKRKDYTFDLCIDFLPGITPHSDLYQLWEELGMIQGREFITHKDFIQVIDNQRNRFIGYTDPDKLQEHMLSFSPEDEKLIKSFTDDIKKFGSADLRLDMGILDIVRMIPMILLFRKYSLPVSEMAAKFKNPVLRNLFQSAFDWHDQSTIFCMMGFAYGGSGLAGYPIGGSLPLARAIAKRYLDLGGEISYNSQVKRILVEENHATGIEISDGAIERADIVVSAADGHNTIFNWLDGKYANEKIRGYYENLDLFPPLVFVSLGVDKDFSSEPHKIRFSLKKPIKVAGEEKDSITLRNHSLDPTMAPEGKTVFTSRIGTNFDYWDKLKDNEEKYLVEKKNIEESVINAISELYPGIEDKIEVFDVATPLTFVRYTGNWKGSYEGWLWNEKVSITSEMPQTLPGLSNFYMAGQWVSPGGGLYGAATTGRKAAKMICKNQNVKFKATKP